MSKFKCGHYGLGQPVDRYCGWKRLAWPPMAVLWNTSAIWGLQNGEIVFRRKLSVTYFGFGFWLGFGKILPLYYLTHYLYHLLQCTCVTEPWHTVLKFHELWNEVRRCYSLAEFRSVVKDTKSNTNNFTNRFQFIVTTRVYIFGKCLCLAFSSLRKIWTPELLLITKTSRTLIILADITFCK